MRKSSLRQRFWVLLLALAIIMGNCYVPMKVEAAEIIRTNDEMEVNSLPSQIFSSSATYDVDAVLTYATGHWNDGQGLCATFASNCMIAGGLNMKVNSLVDGCVKAAESASGLSRVQLRLNNSGYATQSLDGDILGAGDLVAQYCTTCNADIHAMICGGYDSSGIATYYAHNKAKNNERISLLKKYTTNHTGANCNVVAYVVHLSSLPKPQSITPPIISDIRVSNVSSSGYTINCVVTSELEIARVQFPTWTVYNSQDDLFPNWETNIKASGTRSGNTYTYRVNTEDHNNEKGEYATHIYAYDTSGNWSCYGELGIITVPIQDYVLHLNPNGGNFSDSSTDEKTASPQLLYYGFNWNDVGQFTPTRADYTFDGWYTAPTGGTKIYYLDGMACYEGVYWDKEKGYLGQGDLTVYAQWVKVQNYTLYFNPNGGSFSDGTTDTVEASPKLIYGGGNWWDVKPYEPTRLGYSFDGWYTSSAGGNEIYNADGKACYEGTYWDKEKGYIYPGDLTVYARWIRNNYTLTVRPLIDGAERQADQQGFIFDVTVKDENGNDVSGTYGAQNVSEYSKEVPYGYTYTVTPIGNTNGYQTAAASGMIGTQENVAKPIWNRGTVKIYTITYNANGGSNAPASQSGQAGEKIVIALQTPIREGYQFTGWNTRADGKGKAYAAGADYPANADLVLYAQWSGKVEVKTYTITYDANGGTNAPESQSKQAGALAVLATQMPIRTNYQFAGWNTQADGKGRAYLPGTLYQEDADVTLYAQWTESYANRISIEKAKVSKIAKQPFTGKEICPGVVVKLNKRELAEGRDYIVTYANNISSGKATATINGIGAYTGVKTVTFVIGSNSIKKAKVQGIEKKVYNGQPRTQDFVVVFNGNALVKGQDYTVSYEKNINAGTAIMYITGINAYSGTLKKSFKIMPYDINKDVDNLITGLPADVTAAYVKGGCKPEVTLNFAGSKLVEKKDYTVSYSNNKKVTTANTKKLPTITIKGKKNFKGTIKMSFIIQTDLLNAVNSEATYVDEFGQAEEFTEIDVDGNVKDDTTGSYDGADAEKESLDNVSNYVEYVNSVTQDGSDVTEKNQQ